MKLWMNESDEVRWFNELPNMWILKRLGLRRVRRDLALCQTDMEGKWFALCRYGDQGQRIDWERLGTFETKEEAMLACQEAVLKAFLSPPS